MIYDNPIDPDALITSILIELIRDEIIYTNINMKTSDDTLI